MCNLWKSGLFWTNFVHAVQWGCGSGAEPAVWLLMPEAAGVLHGFGADCGGLD